MSAKETIKRIVDSFNSKPQLKDKTREMGEGLMLGASLADDANELSKDVQAQVDQLVIEGDSSVEAAQARVDGNGKSYTTLKKRLDEKEQKVTAQFAHTKKQLYVNPDEFEGTDVEKLQQAYDYANENGIQHIVLNRKYDLTGGSIFINPGYFTGTRIYFHWGSLVKRDTGFMFDRIPVDDGSYTNFVEGNLNENSPEFYNVHFFGNENAKATIINGDVMIRQTFSNCKYKNIQIIKSTKYTQSVRIFGGESERFSDTGIDAPQHLDISIDGIKCETSNHPLLEAITDRAGTYAISVGRFKNLLLEGFGENSPIRISSAIGLDISNLYSEANNKTLEFVETTGVKSIRGSIKNNTFFNGKGICDVDIPVNIDIGSLTVEDNATNIYDATVEKYFITKGNERFKNNNHYGGGKIYPSNLYSGIRPMKQDTNIIKHTARNTDAATKKGLVIEMYPFTDSTGFNMVNAAGTSLMVNISAQVGDSAFHVGNYLAYIHFISAFDTASNSNKVKMVVTNLNKSGTSGDTTVGQGLDTDIQITFASTGNTMIEPSVSANQKIYIIIPKFNYAAATTKISLIPLSRLVQNTNALIPDKSQTI